MKIEIEQLEYENLLQENKKLQKEVARLAVLELAEKARFAFIKEKCTLFSISKFLDIPLKTLQFWKQRDKCLGVNWDKCKEWQKMLNNTQNKRIEEMIKELLEGLIEEANCTILKTRNDEEIDSKTKAQIISDLTQSISRAVDASRKLLSSTSEFSVAVKVLELFSEYLTKNEPKILPLFSSHLDSFAKELELKLRS